MQPNNLNQYSQQVQILYIEGRLACLVILIVFIKQVDLNLSSTNLILLL